LVVRLGIVRFFAWPSLSIDAPPLFFLSALCFYVLVFWSYPPCRRILLACSGVLWSGHTSWLCRSRDIAAVDGAQLGGFQQPQEEYVAAGETAADDAETCALGAGARGGGAQLIQQPQFGNFVSELLFDVASSSSTVSTVPSAAPVPEHLFDDSVLSPHLLPQPPPELFTNLLLPPPEATTYDLFLSPSGLDFPFTDGSSLNATEDSGFPALDFFVDSFSHSNGALVESI